MVCAAAADLPSLAMQNVRRCAAKASARYQPMILFTAAAGARGEHGQGSERAGRKQHQEHRETCWKEGRKEGSDVQKNDPFISLLD